MIDDRAISGKSKQAGSLTSAQAAFFLVSLLALSACTQTQEVTVFSGLKPETPPARSDGCAPVTSRQPTLRWQAFLAAREATESVPGLCGITYELKVWVADHDAPGKLVYVREGLPEPSHTVQEPLSTATTYFWSIRARFLLNGMPRVTDWGQQLRMLIPVSDPQPFDSRRVINHEYYQYYCFQIPSEER
jgi:hypothetical protein